MCPIERDAICKIIHSSYYSGDGNSEAKKRERERERERIVRRRGTGRKGRGNLDLKKSPSALLLLRYAAAAFECRKNGSRERKTDWQKGRREARSSIRKATFGRAAFSKVA